METVAHEIRWGKEGRVRKLRQKAGAERRVGKPGREVLNPKRLRAMMVGCVRYGRGCRIAYGGVGVIHFCRRCGVRPRRSCRWSGPWLTVLMALLAGSSLPAQESLQYPVALAVRGEGEILLADRNLPGVWQLSDGKLQLYFQGQKKFRTPLNAVRSLTLDREGKLLAGDSATRQVYRFDEAGQPLPLSQPAGKQNVGAPGIPMGLAVNSQGEIYVSDLEFHSIWKLPPDGGDPALFAKVPAPIGLAVDSQDRLWVVSRSEGPLRRFTPEGQEEVLVKGRPFEFPHNVALDAEGNAYVVDGYARAIWKVGPDQSPEKWFTHDKFVNPVDIKLHDGKLYVVDPRAKALFVVGPDATAEVIDLKTGS